MRIISIDPGYDRLGIAVMEKSPRGKEVLLFSDCLTSPKSKPIHERFFIIAEKISELLEKYEPETMVLEKVFFTKNRKTSSSVSEIIGIIKYLAMQKGVKLSELTPLQIKMAVTGYGRATKESVLLIVKNLIEIPNPNKKLDDEIDAIACGLAFFANCRIKN